MKGAIIYFSGTGNTEFASKQFKRVFEEKGINCTLVDITKKKVFNDDYDFLVFGSPIHVESFPNIYLNWVKEHIKEGKGRDAVVFSTQAAAKGAGPDILGRWLLRRNFKIKVQDFIEMPNNYFVAGFDRPTKEEVAAKKDAAKEKISRLVDIFLRGESSIKRVTRSRIALGRMANMHFPSYSKEWAQKNLSVDMNICVRCFKCVKGCPTKNISLQEKFEFKDRCISCQKCIHCCPVNAYLYNGRKVEQFTK